MQKIEYYLKVVGIFLIISLSYVMLFIKYSSPCSNVAYLKELGHTIQSKIPPNNITKLIEDGYTVKVRCFETGYINDGGLIRENLTKDGFINYIGNNCTEIKTYEIGHGNNTNFPIPICYGD